MDCCLPKRLRSDTVMSLEAKEKLFLQIPEGEDTSGMREEISVVGEYRDCQPHLGSKGDLLPSFRLCEGRSVSLSVTATINV